MARAKKITDIKPAELPEFTPGKQTLADLILEDFETSDYDSIIGHNLSRQDLHDDVEAVYSKGSKGYFRRDVHISDLTGDGCMRKNVLSFYYEPNIVFETQRVDAIFEAGIQFHQRWQEHWKRAYPEETQIEAEQKNFWKIVFTPDIIGPFRGRQTVIELKGYNHGHYMELITDKELPMAAIVQNNIYMYHTGIHNGLVIVEDKDTNAFTAWVVEYDESLVLPYLPKFEEVWAYISAHFEMGGLPIRLKRCTSPTDPTPKGCRACNACFATHSDRQQLKMPEVWASMELDHAR